MKRKDDYHVNYGDMSICIQKGVGIWLFCI
jgi:hypothetical protein